MLDEVLFRNLRSTQTVKREYKFFELELDIMAVHEDDWAKKAVFICHSRQRFNQPVCTLFVGVGILTPVQPLTPKHVIPNVRFRNELISSFRVTNFWKCCLFFTIVNVHSQA